MKHKSIIIAVSAVIAFVVAIAGCSAPNRVSTLSYPGINKARVEMIGVIPFMLGKHPSSVKETLNCKICQLSFDPDDVVAGADSTLTRYFHKALRKRYEAQVIPYEKAQAHYDGLKLDEQRDTPLSVAKDVGEAVGANLMVLGSVWRYKDLQGSSAGVKKPASVSFDVYLIDVESGNLLWMANFEETQISLTANLLDIKTFFSRGAKWLTANELARFGVKEVVDKFPL